MTKGYVSINIDNKVDQVYFQTQWFIYTILYYKIQKFLIIDNLLWYDVLQDITIKFSIKLLAPDSLFLIFTVNYTQ